MTDTIQGSLTFVLKKIPECMEVHDLASEQSAWRLHDQGPFRMGNIM